MHLLSRTAAAVAMTCAATGLAAVTGVGLAAAQASTTTVGTDTVTVDLTANEHHLAITYGETMCAANIVPPVRGKTPFPFETARCVAGIGHCVGSTPAGHGVRVVFYADRVECYSQG
jgi:hypothetical protein